MADVPNSICRSWEANFAIRVPLIFLIYRQAAGDKPKGSYLTGLYRIQQQLDKRHGYYFHILLIILHGITGLLGSPKHIRMR